MALLVCNGATCACSFGNAPSLLMITPENNVLGCNMPAATVMDNIPMKNIMPFGMCSSLANPTVASATAAALGVLTPMPCIPVIAAPWPPGSPGSPIVLIGGKLALNNSSKLMCNWGGVIQITNPGQTSIMVP